MSRLSHKVTVITLAIVGLFFAPAVSEATYHDQNAVDISSLDTDPVESFPVPVLFGVAQSDLVPDFGDPRGGGWRTHEGQDMRAPEGTPIVSPTEAVVISTGDGPSSGLYVDTANPGGELFRYMHLAAIADIQPGDELATGDFIGTVGDTGNAPDGVYHLHLEVRDAKNIPTDPYPRFADQFSLKEKASFLNSVLAGVEDEDAYANFLATTFETELTRALENEYKLPQPIVDLLEDGEGVDRVALMKQLDQVIDLIPQVLQTDLQVGDTGARVALLQTYLMFRSDGVARDALAVAGATGYYGSITDQAVRAWQVAEDLPVSGLWDSAYGIELAK
jgi:hypothetical protein